MVRGTRAEPGLHRFLVQAFNRLLCATAIHPVPANVGNYSLIGPRALRAIRELPERQRYFPGLRAFVGFKQVPVVLNRGPRYDGQSRMGFQGLARLASQAFFSHTRLVPMVLYALGAAMFACGGLLLAWRAAACVLPLPNFYGSGTIGFGAVCTSLILFGQGLTCDLLNRVYREVSGRPTYLLDHVRRAAMLGVCRT